LKSKKFEVQELYRRKAEGRGQEAEGRKYILLFTTVFKASEFMKIR
jgi:hypothetical protein